jgi:hypothetical protein
MKWHAPSERVQFWIASPIVVPAALMAAPFILFGVGFHWCLTKLFPTPPREWHRWFAWRPVPLDHWSDHVCTGGGWAWLETVERRSMPYNWPTEYRTLARAASEEADHG